MQIMSGMFVRDTSSVVTLRQLQGLPDQSWMEERIKTTVASIDEPERHPNDDELRDHVKQTWQKVKIDLTSDDDEAREQDDENVEMGDGEEEVDDEEEEDLDMDDLNAEKRDLGEKDEVDDYINKEREEVEADEQEEDEIQGGKINIRKFKAGEMQDAVEYPPWMSVLCLDRRCYPQIHA